ncbi:MAG: ChaN family lipoprotein [Gammaproteobacteria bacterium]|nr:ChaN family lipoprotein [Gammaproteobacteria bacterium]
MAKQWDVSLSGEIHSDWRMMRKLFVGLLTVLLLSGLSACSLSPQRSPPEQPAPLLYSDHVLANKIWDVKAQGFISREQLLERAAASEFVFLGETHDNPVHHQSQAWMIDGLKARERSTVVAFEMISQEQEKLIKNKKYNSTASLIAALNHVPASWQYEQYYTPVFESVINADFDIRAASLDRQVIMAIARKGETEIPAHIKTVLETSKLAPEQQASLQKEIEGSHCGMISEQMVSAMMLTQRVKDAFMAESLLGDDAVDVNVLVAGSGHTRNDRGVPAYIRPSRPDANIVALAWLEVIPGSDEVKDYAQHWAVDALPFDYVWFTPRVDRPDPCERFRQHMKKKQSPSSSS